MAELDFVKLGEVEALDSVPDGANALVEVEGEIKRVPGSGLGGGAGIKTAIFRPITDSGSAASAISTLAAGDGARTDNGSSSNKMTFEAECLNMTVSEAAEIIASGGVFDGFAYVNFGDELYVTHLTACVIGVDSIFLLGTPIEYNSSLKVYCSAEWSESGITVTAEQA